MIAEIAGYDYIGRNLERRIAEGAVFPTEAEVLAALRAPWPPEAFPIARSVRQIIFNPVSPYIPTEEDRLAVLNDDTEEF